MNLSQLKKLTGNALTAAAIREAGLSLVPIDPNGSINEAQLKKFIEAGTPDQRFFGKCLLVTPEEMENRRKKPALTTRYDPVSGEPETEASSAAWDAAAPIRVYNGLTEKTVPAADLMAFASVEGYLPAEVTSLIARMFLQKGTLPVDPPEILERAALEWPYDGNAAQKAFLKRSQSSLPAARPVVLPPAKQAPNGYRQTAGTSTRNIGLSELKRFISARYSVDEMRRLFYRAGVDDSQLPEGPVTANSFAETAVNTADRLGVINDTFFFTMLADRPRFSDEINTIRSRLL